MLYRLLFLVIIFSLAFYSCKKDDLPIPGTQRLKNFKTNIGDSIFLNQSIIYDFKNRVAKIVDSTNASDIRVTSIEYNANDNPIWIKRYQAKNPSLFSSDTLLYNSKQQIVKKISSESQNSFRVRTYAYDGQGRISGDTSYHYLNNVARLEGYSKFVYNNSDDVVQVDEFYNINGQLQMGYTQSNSYDGNSNLYGSSASIFYIIGGNYLFLGKHNIKSSEVLFLTTPNLKIIDNYNYQYNGDDLPEKVVINRNYPRTTADTIAFSYE
jgi:hypothetical protein